MLTNSPYDVNELLTRVADGDEAAFQHLFEYYRSHFFGVCMKLSGTRKVAEEAATIFLPSYMIDDQTAIKSSLKHDVSCL